MEPNTEPTGATWAEFIAFGLIWETPKRTAATFARLEVIVAFAVSKAFVNFGCAARRTADTLGCSMTGTGAGMLTLTIRGAGRSGCLTGMAIAEAATFRVGMYLGAAR
jgi:hypothetical protein